MHTHSLSIYSTGREILCMTEGIGFRIRIYFAILASVVVCGTLGLVLFEDLPPFDAFYFVIVTIATVGFGDISPQTIPGKLITLVIILAGVGCFVAVAATLVESFIERRERTERLRKINMLVGVFYSEVGTALLRRFSAVDPACSHICNALIVSGSWTDRDFLQAEAILEEYTPAIHSRDLDLPELNRFLSQNKSIMLTLLENPYLFEYDTFTELMQALFHTTEELRARETLENLPDTDYAHLSGDMNRVYGLLMRGWLSYMQHLKNNFPYLFSLAMRTNPFDAKASPVVR